MGAGADKMKAALGVFAEEVKLALSKTAPALVADVQRELCLDLVTDLAVGNPVDTGHSRANWQVGVQTVPSNILEPARAKGKGEISAGEGEALAEQVVARSRAALSTLKEPDLVYITNNVEYVPHLEDGTSQQAPEGWIGNTLEGYRAQWRDLISEKMEAAT